MTTRRVLHLLEAAGAGGLETRLETIRRLDPVAEHVIIAPSHAKVAVSAFWGGSFVELPYDLDDKLSIANAVAFSPWLLRLNAGAGSVVLHSHTPYAAILLAIGATPDMTHVHTLHGPMWLPWQGKGRKIYEAVLARNVDYLIGVSDEMTDRIHALIASRPVVTLSNAAALLRPQPDARPSQPPTAIAFAGRLEHNKAEGLEALFSLLASLRGGPRLDIFGDGALRARLETLAAPLGSRIRFLGTNMNFTDQIRNYDVIAGEGRVVLEALAAGVPALVCAARLSGFVTPDTLPRLLYANAALRGMGRTPEVTADALLAPPQPPHLPETPSVAAICRSLETQTVYSRARTELATRAKAAFRAYGGVYQYAFDALDYVGQAGEPW
ncbi:hypothetical protein GCM10007291_41660 [Gemmobacter nanjingensis]|uniref:Glycosyltransferase subfamily 4-like N-terminal domain-containing protein n=1 Tax=Gemmobacter nanjingensis TaxID=488454 RepID=A0ABQ3FS19_9RHOB|nr:glycosyltransferase [Gemmobacter nanjingensis]GHC35943.1 hypothetical protein GCM10007291_41660 [Gemmobacter nanjingensis]